MGMGQASSWGVARQRPLEYWRKVGTATRCSGACSHTWPDLPTHYPLSTWSVPIFYLLVSLPLHVPLICRFNCKENVFPFAFHLTWTLPVLAMLGEPWGILVTLNAETINTVLGSTEAFIRRLAQSDHVNSHLWRDNTYICHLILLTNMWLSVLHSFCIPCLRSCTCACVMCRTRIVEHIISRVFNQIHDITLSLRGRRFHFDLDHVIPTT